MRLTKRIINGDSITGCSLPVGKSGVDYIHDDCPGEAGALYNEGPAAVPSDAE